VPDQTPSSLQFDRADFGANAPSRVVCTSCGKEVVQSYYTVGDRVVCSSCHERHVDGGSENVRFVRAFIASFGVAIAGAAVWWAIGTFLHFQLSLVAIAIGFGVARAIIWGTGGRTNVFYQVFAVVMTYAGIVFSFIPDLVGNLDNLSGIDAATALRIIVIAFEAPFLLGVENFIGILIIGIGLWEAWKLTGAGRAAVAGPFSVSPAATTHV
jgi:hypothetical protein